MYEIEAKIRVADLPKVRARLLQIGASSPTFSDQRDVYYNHPQRDFVATDEALRIRYEGERCTITYKGPKIVTAGAKTREEFNLSVESGEVAENILQRLGFLRSAEVYKNREEFALGSATIALDQVEGLGSFVEIEVMAHQCDDEAERRIDEIKGELGIEGEHIPQSYLELLTG
ncbi:class IV adenylate cyclase [Methanofollis fontis]|uniref:Class IV adenylate cyclase n=1 Tax=Methanofollis fontis TaxID=2052832 RepID=A0A483CX90_9EURY|nr:class IV adenylate cyclase [Methanofollis fontis]TAJ43823.1 class IV adenylate cyclase [Methanofollis fontis]